jgi:alpha-beta hydrolase superfamily lysophospholipase
MVRWHALSGVLAGLLLVSCASDTSDRVSAPASVAPAASSPAPTATLPAPAGLPEFYSVPDPLPEGKPGDVIKSEPVASAALHGTMTRVMYHSRSIQDRDIPVTGLIAIPTTPPPAGGYPVISWAHGTTGIADKCAPSLSPDDYASLANNLLDAGYAVVATDYEGLGTAGRHPYIVGESEARGTLDMVRAARNLPDVHASDRYLVWGHSQGGHAAMFALHIADSWAPELRLVGVVAGAPPSQLSLIYAALQTSPFKYYLLMAAAGFNAAYGDEGAPLGAVLTPAGIDALRAVDEGCAGDIGKATADLTASAMTKADPKSVPLWAKLLDDNDPGKFAAPATEPLLIIQGGNDEQIPVAATSLMFDQLCKISQVEQRWIYPGQSHAGVIGPSFGDMLTWINNRFGGTPAPDSVAPVGQSDVQVQRCPA